MGDESEINLPVLRRAIERYLRMKGAPGQVALRLEGVDWVAFPDAEARALVLAGSALETLAALVPKGVKLSE